MTEPLNLDEIEPWLAVCPPCDAGLPAACTHPDGDYRIVIARLVAEVQRLRAGDVPNDIDATGQCCCAGCVGAGLCDRDTQQRRVVIYGNSCCGGNGVEASCPECRP